MKHAHYLKLLAICFILACNKNRGTKDPITSFNITISTPGSEKGYLYIDGKYTGVIVPGEVNIPTGHHTVGVALQNSWAYLKREVDVSEKSNVVFSMTDKPSPKTWKALWVGLNETKGNSPNGDCSTHFSTTELDAAYNFFTWSLKEHFEK